MAMLTKDDLRDLYSKGRQRGLQFLFSKLNPSALERTRSAFDDTAVEAANWWMIPRIREHWNECITGSRSQNYRQWLTQDFLKGRTGLKALSIGCGTASHELELAQSEIFESIRCVDLAKNRLHEAEQKAADLGLSNIVTECVNVYEAQWTEGSFDVILFNSSLHHFKGVHTFLRDRIRPLLKKGGYLIIHEYVGPDRLQLPKAQIRAINECLRLIPKPYRQIYQTHMYKNSFSGSGWLRVYLADPSECVDSSSILPAVRGLFQTVYERPFGGNILMHVLKDIAHHFTEATKEKEDLLEALIRKEEAYLSSHDSDFYFGVYQS